VGLYRTEFLFSSQEKEPAITFQTEAYAYVLRGMDGHSVTIRLCDIEGDKNEQEWLKKTDRWKLWDRQVEAILRASAQTNIRAHILVPTVRDASDMQHVRMLVEQNSEKLQKQGVNLEKPAKVGMMVETPVAALDMDSYAGLADFYSIGSNDLMASLTGIQRTDQHLNSLSDVTHPRILKIFQDIIASANAQGKKISLCGGLASQPDMIGILIGLGLRRLSAGVENVLEIKERIQMIDSGHAKNLVETLMRTPGRAERENILSRFNQELLTPNIVSPNSIISEPAPGQHPA
jgi:phosphotransferase system enzyme I (PtsI)